VRSLSRGQKHNRKKNYGEVINVSIGNFGGKISCKVQVIDKETGKVLDETDAPGDLGTLQLAQIMCANMLDTTQTSAVKDITGTARTVSANSTISSVSVVAGTGSGGESSGNSTAASVTDYALGAIVSGSQGTQTATINSPSGWSSGTSGTFTITANMAAPSSSTTYYEVGIEITIGSYTFLIAHNVNTSGWSVGTTQYLAVTFTQTIQ
jgi:hypothetical protein